MTWRCPYAVKPNGKQFFVCQKALKKDTLYQSTEDWLKAFCCCQRRCACKDAVINSEGARACYERKRDRE